MSSNSIVCGDSLAIVPTLPHARMIFADPPDNLGMEYAGYADKRADYEEWLFSIGMLGAEYSDVFWFSYFHRYQPIVFHVVSVVGSRREWHQFIWRFTFGQHRNTDCGNGYRPLLRVAKPGVQWNTDSIRVQSARQRLGDRRANPEGRVPDDVWEFPRVVGNAHERRAWISNQHPEALIERMILMSTNPGDLVIDLFAGSGTVHRVCKRLGRDSISIDISEDYCKRIEEGENENA